MPGSGVCLVYPFNFGHAQHPYADSVSCMAQVFAKLLQQRDGSGFDVCDLSDVVYRRSLTESSPEVRCGKYPNAPYHSFIYLYYGWYSGIDYAKHITQTPVNLPAQWASDLNNVGETVNHYVFGMLSPDDLHAAWPDATAGPGVGPHVGGAVAPINGAEEFFCTIAGRTASAMHSYLKVTIPTIPNDVNPIMQNAAGDLTAWTYKNRWHYWCGMTSFQAASVVFNTDWGAFIYWVLAHITKVRGIPLATNTVKVWLDIDDVSRMGVLAWYAKLEADPEGIARFVSAARAAGFPAVCIAHEATAPSIAGAPQTHAVIRRLAAEGSILVTPHSHDTATWDTSGVKTEADGLNMINAWYANLAQYNLPIFRPYLTFPGNCATEPLVRAAFSLGVMLLRGGPWVATSTKSEQPLHLAAASGTPARNKYLGYLYRTGEYAGLAVDTGFHFYDWDSLGTKWSDTMPTYRMHALTGLWRGIMLGCDYTDRLGYIFKRTMQPSAHLVYHPSALVDAELGVETLNWLSAWNNIYPVYEGVADPTRYVLTGM